MGMSENFCSVVLSVSWPRKFWSPDKFQITCESQLVIIICVHSCEKDGFHAHVSHEARIYIRVSKGIELPADLRSHTKLISKPVMTLFEIAQYVCIVRGSFIRGD